MSPNRKELLWFGVIAFAAICLRYPLVAIGAHTFFDIDWAIFCEPVAQYNKANLLAGHIPTWCPLLLNGTPYLAQWNTMVMYPGILIYLLLPIHWGLNLFQLIHIAWGAMGMYLLARRFNGGNHAGACVIGFSYEFNGLCLSLMDWPQNLSNYSWIPWVIVLQLRAMKEGGRWFGWAGLATGIHLLTGLPEFNIITWTFTLALGWAERYSTKPRPGRQVRQGEGGGGGLAPTISDGPCPVPSTLGLLVRWSACILLGIAVSAAQILPAAVLTATNADQARGIGNAGWAFDGSGLLNFVHPTYDTRAYAFTDRPKAQIWMTAHYTNLGLTALALVAGWRKRQLKLVMAVFVVSLTWTFLAMGWNHPLARPVLENLPVISRMRYPIKFLLAAVVGIHLLASLFWRTSEKSDLRAACKLNLILPGAALALALVFELISQPPEINLHLLRLALHTAVGLLFLALLRRMISERFVHLQVPLAGLVLLLGTFAATREPNPMVSVEAYRGRPIHDYCHDHGLVAPAPTHGRLHGPKSANIRTNGLMGWVRSLRLAAAGNSALSENLAKQGGFVSLAPHWQELWTTEMGSEDLSPQRLKELRQSLDFCAVQLLGSDFKPGWTNRTSTMPLVSIGQKPVFEPDLNQALLRFQWPGFDPREKVLVPARTGSHPDASASARLEQCGPEHWVIAAEAVVPTLLVISQTWYPGWKATVNGRPAEILRVNVAFQAVRVPAGKSVIELRYTEPGLAPGVGISMLGVGTCVFILLWKRRLTKKTPLWRAGSS